MTFCNCYSQSCLRSTVLWFFITQDTNIICRRLILLRLLVTLRRPNTVLISVRPKYIIPYFYNMKGLSAFQVACYVTASQYCFSFCENINISLQTLYFNYMKGYSAIQVVCYVLRNPNTVLVFVRLKHFIPNFVFLLYERSQFDSGYVLRYGIQVLFLFLCDSNISS